ncbi:MAG: ABC transporter permease [Candidatus Egerieousia sp.]
MKIKDTAIKSVSLGIGLAISIILVAKICFELSYDRSYDGYENIYSIRTGYSQHGHTHDYERVSGAVAPGFRQYVPGVKYATRTTFVADSKRFKEYKEDGDGSCVSGRFIIADTSYFDVFPTEILAGDPKRTLAEPRHVMVSRSFAEKLGGVQEAVGKEIQNDELQGYWMTIGGVFEDFPHQSSQRYDVLLSMESYSTESTENWLGNDRYNGYVRLAEGVDYKMLAPAIRLMQEKNQPLEEMEKSGSSLWYYLAPLARVHTSQEDVRNMLIILCVVAVLLLIISLLNYVLFSISAMVKRSKEIGVRKCYGAGTAGIYGMMIREAVVDVTISLVIATVLILSLRGAIGNLAGVPLEALFVPQAIAVLAVVIVLVLLVTAFVPARLYSNIPIDLAIRNYRENKRIWKLTLLFVQICACAFLAVMVSIIGLQYDKAVNDNPGYEYENLLYVALNGTKIAEQPSFAERLRNIPGVEDVQMSFEVPLNGSNGNNIMFPDSRNELFNVADQYSGSEGLFKMMGIPFVAGRYPQSSSEVAVSESFLVKMAEFADWSDGAVGKQICITGHGDEGEEFPVFTISGVYRNYRIGSLTSMDERASVKFFGQPGKDFMPLIIVKVNDVNRDIMQKLNEVLKETFPQKDVEFLSYKAEMKNAYSEERKMRNTVLAGCAICILIALFGLIGYVRDESERRSKEMAVRKINGAVTTDILGMFVGEIMKLSIAAVLLADAGAYFASKLWLENFAQRITLSPLIFIVADIIVLAIVAATVALNCLSISRSNPVESLKNE